MQTDKRYTEEYSHIIDMSFPTGGTQTLGKVKKSKQISSIVCGMNNVLRRHTHMHTFILHFFKSYRHHHD